MIDITRSYFYYKKKIPLRFISSPSTKKERLSIKFLSNQSCSKTKQNTITNFNLYHTDKKKRLKMYFQFIGHFYLHNTNKVNITLIFSAKEKESCWFKMTSCLLQDFIFLP